MGCAKHLLQTDTGQTLLDFQVARFQNRFQRIVLLTGQHMQSRSDGLPTIPDPPEFKDQGPLAGLLAALKAAESDWVALLGVDQPKVIPTLYSHELAHAEEKTEAVVCRDSDSREQWLCGIYRARSEVCLKIEQALQSGERALKRVIPSLNLK